MAIKNEKDFPLCKKCDFAEVDFELRKHEIKCADCQFEYAFNNLKSETFNQIQKILLPLVKFLNKTLIKINEWLRRNNGN